jgi:hypothetical protein
MKGWSRLYMIFLSLITCLNFPSLIAEFFYITFIAKIKPESFFLTKNTLENPPLPITLSSWKSLTQTYLFL